MKSISASIKKKMQGIKLLVSDVDGVMTDGKLFWLENQGWTRFFSVNDGMGIFRLREAGIDTAVITAAVEKDVHARMERLKITHFYVGSREKLEAYEDLKKKTGFKDSEIAYIGDDIPDVPVLKSAGLAVSVPDARSEIKKLADFVTSRRGGEGAVRELADLLRHHSKFSKERGKNEF